jgi:hypothetical protein
MLNIRRVAHVFVSLFMANSMGVGWAQGAPSVPSPIFPKDVAAIMKPLRAEYAHQCGLTLFYPALKNFFDQEIGPGCTGSYKDNGTVLKMRYWFYPNDPADASKRISMAVNPMGIDDWLTEGKGHDTTFARSGDGVRLLPKYSFGDECHNLVRTEITPISGANWHGWLAEEVYRKARGRSKNEYCKIYAPKNRCIHLVIGNEKMSAELWGKCLMRKRTTKLEEGFSYDLFMEMIRSVRFNEE